MTLTAVDIPRPGQWWPGNSYVNWVGIDGYYLKPSWSFAPLFGPTIGAVRGLTERSDTHCGDWSNASCRPAREDHQFVRRHPPLWPAGVRMV